MVAHAPLHTAQGSERFGDRALHWSWYLLLLWLPWQFMGGGVAGLVTHLAEGDFLAGEGVPAFVYPALYLWSAAPLIASIVLGLAAWVRGHRPAAIAPALISAAWLAVVTIAGAEQFVGA